MELVSLEEISSGGLFKDGDWIESKDQDSNGNIRLLQLADIGVGNFIDKSSKFVNEDTFKRLKCTEILNGDILIARMPDPIGRACLFDVERNNNEKYITAVDVAILRVNENISNKYVSYLLISPQLLSESLKQSTGATRKRISRKKLAKFKIPLPPLATQKKIAAILDEADTLRNLNKKLIEKYDALTQSLFLDMFGDPVTNPMGWEVMKLGDVTSMKAGKYIKASEIHSKKISGLYLCYGGNGLRGYVKSFTHEGEFLLIGRQGALCGNVKIANGRFHATEHAIVCKPIIQYKMIWMYYMLEMMNLNKYATGAAQPGLNVGTLVKIEVTFPPIHLQNQFAERVELIEQQKAQAQESLQKSEDLFNSLLQKAFKGELVK